MTNIANYVILFLKVHNGFVVTISRPEKEVYLLGYLDVLMQNELAYEQKGIGEKYGKFQTMGRL